MEDDERSIDWAPMKIKELEKKIEELRGAVFTEGGDNHAVEAHHRITKETERLNELRDQAANEVEALQDRLIKLERWAASITGSEIRGAVERLIGDEDKNPQFGAPWVEEDDPTLRARNYFVDPEFSPPIGRTPEETQRFKKLGLKYQPDDDDLIDGIPDVHGRPARRSGDTEDRTHLRGTGAPARNGGLFALSEPPSAGVVPPNIAEGLVERGYVLGQKAAMEEAESRVRVKIEEMGWHPNSPAALGMINALRGSKPIKDQPQG